MNDTVQEFWTRPHLTHERFGGSVEPAARYSTRTRVEVVSTDQPRPLQRVTQEQRREWAHACGGMMAIGPSLEEQRRERMEDIRRAAITITGTVLVLGALFWLNGFLVDTFWSR